MNLSTVYTAVIVVYFYRRLHFNVLLFHIDMIIRITDICPTNNTSITHMYMRIFYIFIEWRIYRL